jgi:hypothetical protein
MIPRVCVGVRARVVGTAGRPSWPPRRPQDARRERLAAPEVDRSTSEHTHAHTNTQTGHDECRKSRVCVVSSRLAHDRKRQREEESDMKYDYLPLHYVKSDCRRRSRRRRRRSDGKRRDCRRAHRVIANDLDGRRLLIDGGPMRPWRARVVAMLSRRQRFGRRDARRPLTRRPARPIATRHNSPPVSNCGAGQDAGRRRARRRRARGSLTI